MPSRKLNAGRSYLYFHSDATTMNRKKCIDLDDFRAGTHTGNKLCWKCANLHRIKDSISLGEQNAIFSRFRSTITRGAEKESDERISPKSIPPRGDADYLFRSHTSIYHTWMGCVNKTVLNSTWPSMYCTYFARFHFASRLLQFDGRRRWNSILLLSRSPFIWFGFAFAAALQQMKRNSVFTARTPS